MQTHEHKDHVSGFNLKDKKKKLLWDSIETEAVWLAWTENTGSDGDPVAIRLKEQFEKKKMALVNALNRYTSVVDTARHRKLMESESNGREYQAAQQRYATALEHLLNFYDLGRGSSLGASKRLTIDDAMKYFINRSRYS